MEPYSFRNILKKNFFLPELKSDFASALYIFIYIYIYIYEFVCTYCVEACARCRKSNALAGWVQTLAKADALENDIKPSLLLSAISR